MQNLALVPPEGLGVSRKILYPHPRRMTGIRNCAKVKDTAGRNEVKNCHNQIIDIWQNEDDVRSKGKFDEKRKVTGRQTGDEIVSVGLPKNSHGSGR